MARGKLLFVAPSAYPLGGVQVWLDYIMAGLREVGWRVELALTAGRHHDVAAYLAQHPFAPAHAVDSRSGTQQGRINALRDCFIAAQPDIVVGVNIADVYPAAAGLQVKTVATLHGLQPDFLADFRDYRSLIDAVISTNRLSQRLVADFCIDEARALYAPYGVEPLDSIAPLNASGPLRLGYVGRIENDQKRTNDLAEIVAGARRAGLDVALDIAGGGPDEAELRARIRACGVEDCVHFHGVLSPTETREKIYGCSDALLITSTWETGPIVAWEAMICGVPVLTSSYVGHHTEGALIEGENCMMFPIGDIAAAVERLQRMARPQMRRGIAGAGRDLVLARYTRKKSIAQWDAQLSAVLAMPVRAFRPAPKSAPGGRLDKILGVATAERLRVRLGHAFRHAEPGGEWPHAYGVGAMSEESFWAEAARLDSATACAAAPI